VIVYPATAALPNAAKILKSAIQLVVLTELSYSIGRNAQDLNEYIQLQLTMPQPNTCAAAISRQMPQLIQHAHATPEVGSDCRAGDTQFRKRSPAEDEAGREHDVQSVRQAQCAHGQNCVSGTAEDRVDNEEQGHGHVRTET
jgi:hypothetical protein